LNETVIKPQFIKIEELKEYVPPPVGQSKPSDFNILYHVKLMSSKEDEEQED
jgi:hypothetical protein